MAVSNEIDPMFKTAKSGVVAGFGDLDLEAGEAGLGLTIRRGPDEEGVNQAGAEGAGRLLRHPADGVLGDPEPDLVAGGVELGPEPESPVRFPGGVARGQGPRPAGPVLARPLDDDRQLAADHAKIIHDKG